MMQLSYCVQYRYYQTPFGELIIGSFENALCLCDWRYRRHRARINQRIQGYLNVDFVEIESNECPVIRQTIEQLEGYFKRQRQSFDLPILFCGTDFQKQVWHSLMAIPYGETTTYSYLSQQISNPQAVRAVASANGANALSIIVPCHRVIGHSGELVGYAGGLVAKQKLLDLESTKSQAILL